MNMKETTETERVNVERIFEVNGFLAYALVLAMNTCSCYLP